MLLTRSLQTLACGRFGDRRDQYLLKSHVHTRSVDTGVDNWLRVSRSRDSGKRDLLTECSPESLAHVDHINRLAWRTTDNPSRKQLASCSEDGTLKILIVHIGVD